MQSNLLEYYVEIGKGNTKMRKLCLAILDGFGINETLPFSKNVVEGQSLLCLEKQNMPKLFFDNYAESDAVQSSSNPKFKELMQCNPHTLLIASGEEVGLPSGQMGNSEVGHLNIGAGKIVLQDLLKISYAFKNGDAQKNNKLLAFFSGENLNHHIVGLVSNGNVHSSIEHLKYLIKMAQELNVKVSIHLITDGRDTHIFSGKNFIQEISDLCENTNVSIASVSGRYFAMDREKNLDRTKKYFDTITNKINQNAKKQSILEYVENSYSNNISDEFIQPCLFNENLAIGNADNILFFNFRADRMRQIVQMFREQTQCNIYSFTEYSNDFDNVQVIFEKQNQENTLSEIISNKGSTQLKVAEFSKYAHVTYFLNGGKEKQFEKEDRILVEMANVPTYDLQPEMSAEKVTRQVIKGMEKKYDFICVNYANCDMVGHTGNLKASQKAVSTVTKEILKLYENAIKNNYILVVTADHGNAEIMEIDGNICTTHTTNRVPFVVLNYEKDIQLLNGGALCNIAPTILDLMDIK